MIKPGNIQLLIGVVTGFLGGLVIMRSLGATDTVPSNTAFVLNVNLSFKDLQTKSKFKSALASYSAWISSNEPTTLSYVYGDSDKDELKGLLFERYTDKENGYLKIHRSTAQFKEFRAKLASMQESGLVKVEGQSYLEAGFGHV